jgi:hypothetical protein
MARCEVCRNDYEMSFEVHAAGAVHVFDSFECAIHRMAPRCEHCGCIVIGHGVQGDGRFFCCAPFAQEEGVDGVADDAWWHLNQNTLISSEWGTASTIDAGLVPDLRLGQKYGHRLHFWNLAEGRIVHSVDLEPEHQMVLELGPFHDPEATWGLAAASSTQRICRRRCGDGTGTGTSGRSTKSSRSRPSRPIPASCRPRCSLSARAAAGHRHRSVRGRPDALRLLLGNGRTQAVRRLRSGAPARGRIGAPRRCGPSDAAPGGAGGAAGGRNADGGDQPGRATGLAPGTTSSFPRASAPGWRSRTPTRPPADSGWTNGSPTGTIGGVCVRTGPAAGRRRLLGLLLFPQGPPISRSPARAPVFSARLFSCGPLSPSPRPRPSHPPCGPCRGDRSRRRRGPAAAPSHRLAAAQRSAPSSRSSFVAVPPMVHRGRSGETGRRNVTSTRERR